MGRTNRYEYKSLKEHYAQQRATESDFPRHNKSQLLLPRPSSSHAGVFGHEFSNDRPPGCRRFPDRFAADHGTSSTGISHPKRQSVCGTAAPESGPLFQGPSTTEDPTPGDLEKSAKMIQPKNSASDVDRFSSEAIEEALRRPVEAMFSDEPLENIIEILADKAGIPIRIDRRGLDDLGLTTDIPVTTAIKRASLEAALSIILSELDLTHTIANEHLVITSVEAAESQLITRIYWSGETGLQADRNAIDLITATVTPDTWEELGGPSVIRGIETESGSSSGLVVTTTHFTHRKLQQLLDMIAAGAKEKVIAMEMKSPGLTP
ncbi:DUF4974 domain-containing protein [Rosistilla oblonga]|uniref:DUF4974 domain-containing protein n=1 Tax=Rosistilla oblonga TaxID=2527990 RepID=UPI0011A18719|nr:DUF4974 domain-containing protein [Rosistilla oblonga]